MRTKFSSNKEKVLGVIFLGKSKLLIHKSSMFSGGQGVSGLITGAGSPPLLCREPRMEAVLW